MNFEALKSQADGRLEFFEPAPSEQLEQIRQGFATFELDEYIELLSHSNGVGEIFCEGKVRFVHKTLLFGAAQAIRETRALAKRFSSLARLESMATCMGFGPVVQWCTNTSPSIRSSPPSQRMPRCF
jgi:hypothetical protein